MPSPFVCVFLCALCLDGGGGGGGVGVSGGGAKGIVNGCVAVSPLCVSSSFMLPVTSLYFLYSAGRCVGTFVVVRLRSYAWRSLVHVT